ncbi:MAG: DUF4373 domain-containing protein [Clostridia bacterium]|nr:DUF4373 domain-containing protein [Clostridia bacterium]
MARPQKATVDYFPHFVDHGKTMFIIETLWGNDGYAFWFKLLELLGNTSGHAYDCNKPDSWAFLLAKTRLSEDTVTEILNKLAELEAIDSELWSQKVIWSQNFVNGLEPVYKKRKVEMPVRPSFRCPKPSDADVSGAETPQSKVEKSKAKENPPSPPTKSQPFRSQKQRDQFDEFWHRYPRKKSKGQAERAWAKLNPDEQLHEAILDGLERAKTSADWVKDSGAFIPYPATWLNARGWEDEHRPARGSPPGSNREKEIALIKTLYLS